MYKLRTSLTACKKHSDSLNVWNASVSHAQREPHTRAAEEGHLPSSVVVAHSSVFEGSRMYQHLMASNWHTTGTQQNMCSKCDRRRGWIRVTSQLTAQPRGRRRAFLVNTKTPPKPGLETIPGMSRVTCAIIHRALMTQLLQSSHSFLKNKKTGGAHSFNQSFIDELWVTEKQMVLPVLVCSNEHLVML